MGTTSRANEGMRTHDGRRGHEQGPHRHPAGAARADPGLGRRDRDRRDRHAERLRVSRRLSRPRRLRHIGRGRRHRAIGQGARDRARGGHDGDLFPERLGCRLCRGGRARLAQLAQVQCAQDDAREAGAAGQIARPRRLGLRSGRGAEAGAGRYRPVEAPLFGLLQFAARQRAARARHPQSGLRRHRHQRLRRIDAARRLLPRIFRNHARGRDPPGRSEFVQRATVYNVETFFGWVSTVADFCGAFGQIAEE